MLICSLLIERPVTVVSSALVSTWIVENPPAGVGSDPGGAPVGASVSANTPDEAATTDRQRRTDEILASASRRDEVADARDAVSAAREKVDDLEAFLGPDHAYHGFDQRLAAAADRSHAKGDRRASARDRVELTEANDAAHPPDKPEASV